MTSPSPNPSPDRVEHDGASSQTASAGESGGDHADLHERNAIPAPSIPK